MKLSVAGLHREVSIIVGLIENADIPNIMLQFITMSEPGPTLSTFCCDEFYV